MKWILLLIIYAFLTSVIAVGVPLEMTSLELSRKDESVTFQSESESIVQIVGRASELRLECSGGGSSTCVRPRDYTHLRAHFPIQLEFCRSVYLVPRCDDLRLLMHYTTQDLLTIGLRL
jgi:hypothetical protein